MLKLLACAWLAASPAAPEEPPAAHGEVPAVPEVPSVPEAPKGPELPTPSGAPAAVEVAGARADAGVTPRAELPGFQSPSLAPLAMCAELRQNGEERASKKNRWQEERKALATERARLEKLASDIAAAREGLKAETARLEKLINANAARRPVPATAPEETVAKAAAPKKADPAQLATLAKTMKAMKPEQAAALVQRLDRALAVDLIGRMSPALAGAVIAKLSPELAAEMMTSLATRPPAEAKK